MIESFKSTLDEVREADILLHVVDVAHPFHDSQIEVVGKTLTEIGAGNKNTILVLNKIDKLDKANAVNYDEMKGYYRQHGFSKIVFVSAASGENIDQLKETLFEEVKKLHVGIYPNYLKNGYEYPFVPDSPSIES